MPASLPPPDLEKALHLLVHDLRAPLSVAHGYLRLVREHRLPSASERDRALAQTAEALGRISHLCDEALAYAALPIGAPGVLTPITAEAFGARLADLLVDGPPVAGLPLPATAQLRLPDPVATAQALATVASAVWQRYRRHAEVAVHARLASHTLRVEVGPPGDVRLLDELATVAFDPWKGGHGLSLPRACALLEHAGGRIWTLDHRYATAINLPLETQP